MQIHRMEINRILTQSYYIYIYICLDFIQGACTESLDGQLRGAITHPPHP